MSETEKREFWSVQKLIEWVLVAISSCSIGPFSLQKFFTEDILYAFVLSPGFISENFVLSEIDVEKKQVNTGITRIFRQHQFIEFRNVNVSYMNSNIKLCFLYQFSFPEIVAGSEITIWMDIQYYWQFLQLKPDIINDLCQSMVQFKWQSNCRQFKWGWTVTILFQTDWKQTNGEVKKKISFEWGFTTTVIIEMDGNKQMVKNETLPEARRTQGIAFLTWVISSVNKENALALVPYLATKWHHLHQLQIWPPDCATCISCKLDYQMAPLALVANLTTRWHN